MIQKKCEVCGVIGEFIHYYKKGVRCKKWSIQWANKDHKYERNQEDYIGLCANCHTTYDRKNNHKKFSHHISNITKKKLSQTKLGEKNPMFGKVPWNKGLKGLQPWMNISGLKNKPILVSKLINASQPQNRENVCVSVNSSIGVNNN